MNPEEYGRMFELEDHYWWFVARRRLAVTLMRAFLAPNGSSTQSLASPRPRILDLGCGTGAVLAELDIWADVVGADMSLLALDKARSRGKLALVQCEGTQLPFRPDRFDAVICLDVFEHIEDDRRAIGECARLLKPGGLLVLSVPAFRGLWGPHDVALHHFRRYRAPEVRERLKAAGLEPVRVSYSVFFLFPIVVLIRLFEKRRHGPAQASLPAVPGWVNGALLRLGAVEAWLITRLPLPWGSSVVAVGRKPRG